MLGSISDAVIRSVIVVFLVRYIPACLVLMVACLSPIHSLSGLGGITYSGSAHASTVINYPKGGKSKISAYSVSDCIEIYKIEDENQICGFLSVPENYAYPAKNRIEVPFLIILPEEYIDTTLPMFIAGGGGPGNAILGPSAYGLQDQFWTYDAMSIDSGRAMVVIENRGVGLSQPSLRCSEYTDINTILWQEKESRVTSRLLLDADIRCADRLRGQGIDLSQYNAVNAARDIEQLRILLNSSSGIKSEMINVYGISYGTRVAMHYESMYSQYTRSLILDSIVSPFDLPIYSGLKYAQQAFDRMFELCRNDSHCVRRYGEDLEDRFYAYLLELDSRDKSITILEPITLKPVNIPLTGKIVISAMHGALYSHEDMAGLPSVIFKIVSGIHYGVADLIRDDMVGWTSDSSMYDAANVSYLCFDDNYSQLPILDMSGYRLSQYWSVSDGIDYMTSACKAYGIKSEGRPPSRSAHIASPVLLLSGQLDPVTPVVNADVVENIAEFSWNLQWDNIAHDVMSHSGCARLLASWFIYELDSDPAERRSGCLYPETELNFVLL